jgi:amino acid adenylation domain-containing protein
VLKSGAAYLPLDPGLPAERVKFMLSDAGVRVLVTQAAFVPELPGENLQIIAIDDGWFGHQLTRPVTAQATPSELSPDNLAYVIYTSGSTGKPKGVMSTHRGMCNLVLWMQEAFPLESGDRMVQRTAFSFDASIWEFFWPLTSGATLVVASPEAQKDGELLLRTLVDEQITILQIVQSLLDLLLETGRMSQARALRHLFCGGEAMSRSVYDRFHELPLTATLHNVYGPTEASMHVTHYCCPRSTADSQIPIGTPIGNISMYIVDRNLQPVPASISGSLYISGIGLARGYLNREELSAERFIPNPYGMSGGELLYLTGDVARYRDDGNIEFLGRVDQQVKIRGFRIEPGEIEATLRQHPAVFQAVVLARETSEQKRLVGYVVLKPGSAASAGGLRTFLSGTLPDHMIPSAFIFLDAIPLMSSGKADLKALPDVTQSREGLDQAYVEPRNEVEFKLAAIFGEVLSVEGVGADDNFFALGGHSLNATQVTTRIRESFHVDVPLRKLFEAPTVAGLGKAIEEAQPSLDPEGPIEIVHARGPAERSPLESLLDDISPEELESLLAEIAARKKK